MENAMEPKSYRFRVAGTTFHESEISSIGLDNPDYSRSKKSLANDFMIDERIFQYEFYPRKCELVPEPENQHDSNAIRVDIDGVSVGYIGKQETDKVREILNTKEPVSFSAKITGGKYKIVEEADEIDDKGNSVYSISRDKAPYSVLLTITVGEQKPAEPAVPPAKSESPLKIPAQPPEKPKEQVNITISAQAQKQLASAAKVAYYGNVFILSVTLFATIVICGVLFYAVLSPKEQPSDRDNLKTLIKLCVQDQYVSTTEFRWPEDSEWYIETTDVDGGSIYEVETYFGMPDASGKFLKHYLAATAYRDDNAKEWGVSSMAIDAQSVFG